MNSRTLRRWSWVHTWSSLICTVFLLLLALTGLPLIFQGEIDALLGDAPILASLPADTPTLPLETLVHAAQAQRPGEVVQYLAWDAEQSEGMRVITAKTADTEPNSSHTFMLDTRTAAGVAMPSANGGLLQIVLRLHTDIFLGLPGKLLMAAMGVLFAAAIVSGVVLYAPFMRRLPFGTVRRDKSTRTRWLDLHNLLGVVAVVWMLVVGLTGTINACADLVIDAWRNDSLAAMTAPYLNAPPLSERASADTVLAIAATAAPGMRADFIAFPGTRFSSPHHYTVFMKGTEQLTAHLWTPVLIDAATLQVTAVGDRPWYMNALGLAQPLHFGDYGGLPMRILWAVLDVLTIIVLGSGLYLWWARRRNTSAPPHKARA